MHRRSASPRVSIPIRFGPILVLMLAVAATCIPGFGRAQIYPPAPGVDLPRAYYDRVAEDRTVFQFRRAWLAETDRAAERRRLRDIGLLDAAAAAVSGTRYVPVIAGKFANTGADPYSPAQLQDQLFDGPNPTGTVTDYYDEISYGQINLTGVVYPQAGGLLQVSQSDTYYEAGCNGLCGTAKTGEYLKELLDGTDPTVDFGQFDNDGPDGIPNSGDDDGYVDFAAFVHPETGGECGGTNLWSHRWVYEGWWGVPYTTDDPAAAGGFIRVSDYTIQPILSCDGTSIIEIGVYAHEFGHAFGLPDLYDTDSANGSSAGVGGWCLMGSGSYGGDQAHPETPAHMSAWCKEQLGWVTPTVLCDDASGLSLPDVETTGEVLKIYPHGLLDPEYFLIENRVQTGYDLHLYTSGLAIWHVDNDQPGNGDETLKLVDLEEADGLAEMDANLNRGNAGDLFPGSSNNSAFTDFTNPDARDNLGTVTQLAVTGIDATVNPRGFDIALTPCDLAVGDAFVDDSDCGNNNGRLDSFERSRLAVCLRNDFAAAKTGVYGILTALTGGVTVHADSVHFGTVDQIAPNCGSGGFDVEIPGFLAPGTLAQFRIDLYGDSGYTGSHEFSLGVGDFVLIVEDDGAADNDAVYQNTIANAGYSWVHHDVGVSGVPGIGRLAGALAVIWYVGSEAENTLTPAEQAVLSEYLDGGGRLFLNGQDIGYDLVGEGNSEDQAFYQDYLRATYLADSSNDKTLTGVAGDPVGDGLSLSLAGTLGSDLWPDIISGGAGTSNVFLYSTGIFGAIRYDAAYSLVYFGFDFERITIASTRNTIMSRVLALLVPADIAPPTVSLVAPDGGEVFSSCGTVDIQWTASDNLGVVTVDLEYSDDGGSTYQPIASGVPNTGSYLWSVSPLAGADFRVRVKARDAVELQGCDASTASFTLTDATDPTVAVAWPNGGEEIAVGEPLTISWSMDDDCSGVDSSRVWLSVNGGADWTWLATVAAPDTSLAWAAPGVPHDSCLVRVEVFDGAQNGAVDESDAVFAIVQGTTGSDERFVGATVPALLQNTPNPFRLATRLSFHLPESGWAALRVYDLSGRLAATLVEETRSAGRHEVVWDGRGDDGRPLGAGIYFYVLETVSSREVRKLVLSR